MAIALAKAPSTGFAGGTASSTITLPATTVGNKLILQTAAWQWGTNNTSAPVSVTDNRGNTWSSQSVGPYAVTGDIDQGQQVSVWAADVVTAGDVIVTVTWPNATTWAQFSLEEWSGLAPQPALDQTAAASGSPATNRNYSVGPTAATTQADELAIAVIGASGPPGTPADFSTPASYTNVLGGRHGRGDPAGRVRR